MLASVPKPGRCLSGIQPSKTTMLMKKVDQPSESGVCLLNPWESTLHGAFPSVDWMSRASPNPNIVKPNIKIKNRGALSDHCVGAVQLVRGIVRCGRNKFLMSTKAQPSPRTWFETPEYELRYPRWKYRGRPVPCCEKA